MIVSARTTRLDRRETGARRPLSKFPSLVLLFGLPLVPSCQLGPSPAEKTGSARLGGAAVNSSAPASSASFSPRPAAAARTASAPQSAGSAPATGSAPPQGSQAEGPCPAEMVNAGNVCIDRFEAHLLARTKTGNLERHPHQIRPEGSTDFLARSEAGVLPQAYISKLEADSACKNSGKRLCSVAEWYAACRGAQNTQYPYGRSFEAGRCNVGKPHLLSRFFGTNPRAWKYDEHFNDPHLDELPGFLEPTGHFPSCRSSFGAYDMVGNLHEWVADRVDASLAFKIPLKDGIRRRLRRNTGKGIFMGGFFSTTSEHGRGCGFVTIAHEARYHDYSTGFRCCRDL